MSSAADPAPTDTSALLAAAEERIRTALPLRTGRCLLREVTAQDAPAMATYRGQADVVRHLGHAPVDTDGMTHLIRDWHGSPGLTLVVLLLDDPGAPVNPDDPEPDASGTLIGDLRLSLRRSGAMPPATTEEIEASLGYVLHPDHRGRGLATEAVAAAVRAARDHADLRRISARVFVGAHGSSRLLGRLGFTLEGTERAAVLARDGRTWFDDEWWSLLRGEPLADL